MKTRTRRGLSLVLALIMILSTSGLVTAFATVLPVGVSYESAQQIVSGGATGSNPAQYSYYKADGTTAGSGNYDVALKKTVSGTEANAENVFDIKLEVMTTQDLGELEISADAAVVLVMDVSNSMKDKLDGTSTSNAAEQRITLAKNKAADFVNSYVTGAGDAKRMISLVEFGANAKTVSGWVDANSGAGVLNSDVVSSINSLAVNFEYTTQASYVEQNTKAQMVQYQSSPKRYRCSVCGVESSSNLANQHSHCTYPGCTTPADTNHTHAKTENDEGGTNIEGGLMLARNLLTAGQATGGSIAGIKSVYVILLSDGQPTYHVDDEDENTSELAFFSGSRGGGSFATWDDFVDVPGVVDDIQSASAKVFAVCFASDGLKVNWSATKPSNPDYDYSYGEIGITTWFADKVGVNSVLSAVSASDLGLQLTQISQIITKLAQAWLVTDEMGGNILFDASNLIANGGKFSTNSNNTYYYDSANGQIVWDVKNDLYGTTDDGVTTYTLTYRVVLNNAAAGFVSNTAYPTNGVAELKYLVLGPTDDLLNMTPAQIDAKMKTAAFTSPTVKGFLGSLTFNKTSAYNDLALDGATFQLAATANGITVTKTAVSGGSGTAGQVLFENLPSGFTYTLTETAAATGYKLWAGSKTLAISGGVIHSSSTIGNNDTIENELDPGTKTITIVKVWRVPTGTELPAGITIDLKKNDTNNQVVTMSSADAVTGNPLRWEKTVTVDKINPATGADYVYTVSERTLSGYSTSVDGLTIINALTGLIDEIDVTKVWVLPEGMAISLPCLLQTFPLPLVC